MAPEQVVLRFGDPQTRSCEASREVRGEAQANLNPEDEATGRIHAPNPGTPRLQPRPAQDFRQTGGTPYRAEASPAVTGAAANTAANPRNGKPREPPTQPSGGLSSTRRPI